MHLMPGEAHAGHVIYHLHPVPAHHTHRVKLCQLTVAGRGVEVSTAEANTLGYIQNGGRRI